jgi:hypothetical protein
VIGFDSGPSNQFLIMNPNYKLVVDKKLTPEVIAMLQKTIKDASAIAARLQEERKVSWKSLNEPFTI